MPVEKGLGKRMEALIEAASSQKELARISKISEGTIINWTRDLGAHESTLRKFAANVGVAMEWLRDGEGDQDEQIESFLQTLQKKRLEGLSGARLALRSARLAAGFDIAHLARRVSRDAEYIRALEEGHAPISENTAELLAAAIPGLSKADLIGGSDSPRIINDGVFATHGAKPSIHLQSGMKGRMVPLLSSAQAGTWDAGHTDGRYDHTGVFALNVDDRRAFALTATGNSMEPEINHGDIVICSPSASTSDGDAVVVQTKSEHAFIKYLERQQDAVVLISANPGYGPIRLPMSEVRAIWAIVQKIQVGKITRKV